MNSSSSAFLVTKNISLKITPQNDWHFVLNDNAMSMVILMMHIRVMMKCMMMMIIIMVCFMMMNMWMIMMMNIHYDDDDDFRISNLWSSIILPLALLPSGWRNLGWERGEAGRGKEERSRGLANLAMVLWFSSGYWYCAPFPKHQDWAKSNILILNCHLSLISIYLSPKYISIV